MKFRGLQAPAPPVPREWGQTAHTARVIATEGDLSMTDPTELTRRTMLTFGSLGAFGGALVLAGCAADVPPE